MHMVVFDIDRTLTNTNLEGGKCYRRSICEVLGLSSEQPESSGFVTSQTLASLLSYAKAILRLDLSFLKFRIVTRKRISPP
jgi:hypothetical protein